MPLVVLSGDTSHPELYDTENYVNGLDCKYWLMTRNTRSRAVTCIFTTLHDHVSYHALCLLTLQQVHVVQEEYMSIQGLSAAK